MPRRRPILIKPEDVKGASVQVAKYVSEIKRINTRLDAIANTFGIESQTYKQAIAPLQSSEFSPYITITKDGRLHMSQSKKVLTSEAGTHLFNIAKKTKTLTQIKEQKLPAGRDTSGATKQYIEEIEERTQLEQEMASEIAGIMSDIMATRTDKEYQIVKDELYQNGSKMTYEDFKKLKEDYEAGAFDDEQLPILD